MNLKIGGSNVGKIMYNGQEFGGAAKLESGTIIYTGNVGENIHLLSSGKKWKNISEIKVKGLSSRITQVEGVATLNSLPVTFEGEEGYWLKLSKSEIDDDYVLNVAASWKYAGLEISVP